MSAAREGGRGREIGNAIGGAARIYGPTVPVRDVHGGIHVRTVPLPPPPTPRQLPPSTAYFTARQDDQAALDQLLATGQDRGSGRALIVVTGPAGIGETTLVSHWLRRHENCYALALTL